MSSRRYLIPNLLLLALISGGCQQAPSTGDLVVPVTLGNYKECDETGVETLEAVLGDDEYSEDVDCEDGEIRFSGVTPGLYDLEVRGLDEDDDVVMDNGDDIIQVEVLGDGVTVTVDPSVRISDSPARIRIRWDFGFIDCDQASVNRFELVAYETGGSNPMLTEEIPCSVEKGDKGYYTVDDPERDLTGSRLGEVSVQPLDSSGTTVGDPVLFAFDEPGAGKTVKLTLECEKEGCSSDGNPD